MLILRTDGTVWNSEEEKCLLRPCMTAPETEKIKKEKGNDS